MGNCCRSASSSSAAVWAGDDWGFITNDKHQVEMFDGGDVDHEEHDKQRLLVSSSLASAGSKREVVKIKITKRELEEIMARVNVQGGMSMEEVLGRLMNSSSNDHKFEVELQNHRNWKPVLQSIPEVT